MLQSKVEPPDMQNLILNRTIVSIKLKEHLFELYKALKIRAYIVDFLIGKLIVKELKY